VGTRRYAPLSAGVLRERLPATPAVAEERERKICKTTDPVQIERVLKSFRDFVALCERKEAETGEEPCLIIAK
jgi:hypothetical protein